MFSPGVWLRPMERSCCPSSSQRLRQRSRQEERRPRPGRGRNHHVSKALITTVQGQDGRGSRIISPTLSTEIHSTLRQWVIPVPLGWDPCYVTLYLVIYLPHNLRVTHFAAQWPAVCLSVDFLPTLFISTTPMLVCSAPASDNQLQRDDPAGLQWPPGRRQGSSSLLGPVCCCCIILGGAAVGGGTAGGAVVHPRIRGG